MAGQDGDIVVEREDLVGHRLHEGGERSAGEIGPADRTGEEVIAAEQQRRGAVRVEAQAHASHRVAGSVQTREFHPGALHNLTVVEVLDELWWAHVEVAEHAPERTTGAAWIEKHVAVVAVDVDRDRMGVGLDDLFHTADVVDVAMGREQRHELEPVMMDPLEQAGRVRRCVDEHALAAWPVGGDDVGVGLRDPERQLLDEEGHGWINDLCSRTRAGCSGEVLGEESEGALLGDIR